MNPNIFVTSPPEWLRVKDACRLASISRSVLYELMRDGIVKSVSLRRRGNSRGSRRVNAESLREFMESHVAGQTLYASSKSVQQ